MEQAPLSCETDCPQLGYFADIVQGYARLREDIYKEGGYAEQIMQSMDILDEQIAQNQERPDIIKELSDEKERIQHNLAASISNCDVMLDITPELVLKRAVPLCRGGPEIRETPEGAKLYCRSQGTAESMHERMAKNLNANKSPG